MAWWQNGWLCSSRCLGRIFFENDSDEDDDDGYDYNEDDADDDDDDAVKGDAADNAR